MNEPAAVTMKQAFTALVGILDEVQHLRAEIADAREAIDALRTALYTITALRKGETVTEVAARHQRIAQEALDAIPLNLKKRDDGTPAV